MRVKVCMCVRVYLCVSIQFIIIIIISKKKEKKMKLINIISYVNRSSFFILPFIIFFKKLNSNLILILNIENEY